jgi:hypothetical protein
MCLGDTQMPREGVVMDQPKALLSQVTTIWNIETFLVSGTVPPKSIAL